VRKTFALDGRGDVPLSRMRRERHGEGGEFEPKDARGEHAR
jgi:hypothetical protein